LQTTILLVEDNKIQKIVNERMLHKAGYTVLNARDGEEALRLAHETIPDIILLDIMVRGGNLDPLERRLMESHTTVIIPFDDRVCFVGLFNCAEFSGGLPEGAQTLDAISGIQFLVGGRRLGERRPLGTV
jgi:hypothetical protein